MSDELVDIQTCFPGGAARANGVKRNGLLVALPLADYARIEQLLGVRRAGITRAATVLQRAGLIRYTRGRIIVPDREALQARACECYAAGA